MRKQKSNLGDLTGQKFGKLTVVSYAGTDKHQKRRWNCQCECGKPNIVSTTSLRLGKVQSCGCYFAETHTKHGDHRALEYFAWRSMKARCTDAGVRYYEKYGGRGIKVCERWLDYENFLSDMGRKPTKAHSLDRIDNDGDYTPENCRWATKSEQTRNRSTSVWITFNGKTQLMGDWAAELGISYRVLYQRVRIGWTVERAFTTPVKGLK